MGERAVRPAGTAGLVALGVAAAIDGQLTGWNLGIADGGWGGAVLALGAVLGLYAGLAACLGELAAALPGPGGPRLYAAEAFGPRAGRIAGLCSALEYGLIAPVAAWYLGDWAGRLTGSGPELAPVWWGLAFTAAAAIGLSWRASLAASAVLAALTIAAVAALAALAVGQAPATAPGALLPRGLKGAAGELPSLVWMLAAVEMIPLAAPDVRDPARQVPRALMASLAILAVSAATVLLFAGTRADVNGASDPVIAVLRRLGPGVPEPVLAALAMAGLAASLVTGVFAAGRQAQALSGGRAGALAVAGGGLGLMLLAQAALGPARAGPAIAGSLLNAAIAAAAVNWLITAAAFAALRARRPGLRRPWRSPLGMAGAATTAVLALALVLEEARSAMWREGALGILTCLAAGAALPDRHGLRRAAGAEGEPEPQAPLS